MLALAHAADVDTAALELLDDAERERYAAMASEQRRLEFAAGRGLVKQLLERATGRPAGNHAIDIEASGRPTSDAGYGISIAHSGGLVACAVAKDLPIGVDVERPSSARNTGRIAEQYFTTAESDWLAGEPPESFYRLWVLKEAWLKAEGTGIAGGLSRLCCSVDGTRIDANVDGEEAGALFLYEWQGAPVGVATGKIDSAPAVFEWPSDRAGLEPVDLAPTCRTAAAGGAILRA